MSKTPAQRARKHGARAAVAAPGEGAARGPAQHPARSAQPGEGNPKLIIIAALGATVFMFWYLHLLALNQMTQLSGGLAMPDSMFAGFAPEYAGQLRDAMDGDALGQLSYVHKTAATIFALVFGITFLLVIGTLVRTRTARRSGFGLVAAFVVIRLWGNVAIDGALASQPFDTGQATLASVLVVAGWALFLAILLISPAAALLSRRRKAAAPVTEA
jgi:hypothetical protein